MWNHSIPELRRPLTPVLEQPEVSSPSADTMCTFDPGYRLSSTDPQVIEEFVTSPHSVDQVIKPLANDLSELEEQMQDVYGCPGDGGGTAVLDRTWHVYNKACRVIDVLEKQLVLIKKKLKKVSNEYSANHERATSAMSRHRMVKGLREVADDKATLWREQCRNFELGYSQERPEFEQMKNIHSILKASMEELVERNKYLVSFVKLIKRRSLKQYEDKYRNQVGANHSGTESHMLRQQFEEAIRNQLDLRNMGNPALRKGLDFQDQLKKFGRSLPRPPFAPLNVFKLNALAPYLGRSCVRYGGGKVYTLKVDINKHMLKDEETFGRTTPETKDHLILSGKNCLHDPETVLFGDCVLSQSEMFGYSKLPSIRCEAEGRQMGEGRTGHISAPRTSIVKHVATKKRHSSKVKRSSKCMKPLKTATHGNQKKPKSKPYSGKKSHFRVSLNNWGHQDEVDAESVTKGEVLTHGQPVRHAESNPSSVQTAVKEG